MNSRRRVTTEENGFSQEDEHIQGGPPGQQRVGKSNLLSRLNGKGFSEEFRSTIGVEFLTKIIEVDDDVKVKAQIWDTAGQERFSQMMGTYYRNAKAPS